MNNDLLTIIGVAVLVLGLLNQVRQRSRNAAYRRSAFGTVQERHSWSPARWPDGRAAWRSEFKLWFKIAVYSALAGAIFTLVVTH